MLQVGCRRTWSGGIRPHKYPIFSAADCAAPTLPRPIESRCQLSGTPVFLAWVPDPQWFMSVSPSLRYRVMISMVMACLPREPFFQRLVWHGPGQEPGPKPCRMRVVVLEKMAP